MVTIVFTHPWHGSFNKVILDTITTTYDKQNKEYQVIDLHKDEFNPVYSETELALYNKGNYEDEHVKKYQEFIAKSDEIIFIFPIWWTGMPAMLKGFFDKVLLKDFAFNYTNGWTPLLKIDKALVITTAEQSTQNLKEKLGDPIGDMINNVLNSVGINNGKWLNCDHVSRGTDEHRKSFLKQVEETI